uniref:Uncharacterized protein n=1 Tax=Parastrongyloides trichosuri TaxID=131310 RepID=A0A0N4Z8U3_PARTI
MEQLNFNSNDMRAHLRSVSEVCNNIFVQSSFNDNFASPSTQENFHSLNQPENITPLSFEQQQQLITNFIIEKNKNFILELHKKINLLEIKTTELERKNEIFEKIILDLLTTNKTMKEEISKHESSIDVNTKNLEVTSSSLYNCVQLFNEDTIRIQKILEENNKKLNYAIAAFTNNNTSSNDNMQMCNINGGCQQENIDNSYNKILPNNDISNGRH